MTRIWPRGLARRVGRVVRHWISALLTDVRTNGPEGRQERAGPGGSSVGRVTRTQSPGWHVSNWTDAGDVDALVGR